MSKTTLSSSNIKAFCENTALMLSVGVQIDEAAHMLAENAEDRKLERVCDDIYQMLAHHGVKLSRAMEETDAFPAYAVEMVAAGERTGHIQATLESLASYYDEESRLSAKIRQSITYPAILLCVMSIILAFVVSSILPIFLEVYQNMAGGIATSSFSAVTTGIVIGWVALIVTLICTALVLAAALMGRTDGGRRVLMGAMRFIPGAGRVFGKLALSRFASTLAIYISSGENTDDAMAKSIATIDSKALRAKAEGAYRAMVSPTDPKTLVQALDEFEIIDPIHVRMLVFGMKSGRIDEVLQGLSRDVFDEAIAGLDGIIDRFEPVLAGFVTVAVGCTLISVMLPLVGMIGSIG